MKKFLLSILAVLYLVSSAGATVRLHYCMGRLVSRELQDVRLLRYCDKCGMPQKLGNGCCKDEHKHVSIAKDQQLAGMQPTVPDLIFREMPVVYGFSLQTFSLPLAVFIPVSHAPPPGERVGLFVRYCTFLI